MTKYLVNRRSWFPTLGLVEPGTPVEWDGLPGTNLDPTDDAGEKAKKEAARVRAATAAAQQAAQQMADGFRTALASAYEPPESSFAEQGTAEAPEARRAKSGVLKPAEQVPEGDAPGPSPSVGGEVPPDTSTFVPAGIVTNPQPAATVPAPTPPDDGDEDDEPPPPRRRRRAAEPSEEQ